MWVCDTLLQGTSSGWTRILIDWSQATSNVSLWYSDARHIFWVNQDTNQLCCTHMYHVAHFDFQIRDCLQIHQLVWRQAYVGSPMLYLKSGTVFHLKLLLLTPSALLELSWNSSFGAASVEALSVVYLLQTLNLLDYNTKSWNYFRLERSSTRLNKWTSCICLGHLYKLYFGLQDFNWQC